MKIREVYIFPCGLKIKMSASGVFLGSWQLKDAICPLHGKNCKQPEIKYPEFRPMDNSVRSFLAQRRGRYYGRKTK